MARKKSRATKKIGATVIDKTLVTKKKKANKNKPNNSDVIQEDIILDEILCSPNMRKNNSIIAKTVKPVCEVDNTNIIQEEITLLTPERSERHCIKCPVHGIEFVVEENVLKEDFIPLSTRTTNSVINEVDRGLRRSNRLGNLERVSATTATCSTSEKVKDPIMITVDDEDDGDEDNSGDISVCVDVTDGYSDNDSVNDSIEIVTEMNPPKARNCSSKIIDTSDIQISLSKKRKLDDSIEILEPCDSKNNHLAKKPRIMGNVDNSPAISSSEFEIIEESQNNNMQDDDIVIVDTIDSNSRDSVMVLNDTVPTVKSVEFKKKKKKRDKMLSLFRTKICRRQKEGSNSDVHMRQKEGRNPDVCGGQKNGGNPHFSSVFQDTVGNTQMSSPRYRSPLSGVSTKEMDQSVSYHNINGNNMYNPNNVQKTGLRPVVIDGSNVAFHHGGNTFSTRGIEICVNYFVKRGHWVVAFVPLFRRSEVSEADRKILDDLQHKRQLAFTPSRFLNRRRVASYDDRFIVQCAAELGGIVVSTDNYKDLVCENEAWRETIEKRLLMFTWVGDILMFPDDPNGRGGPRLEEFLRFPQ